MQSKHAKYDTLIARADSVTTRLASCAVAALVVHARRADASKAVAS